LCRGTNPPRPSRDPGIGYLLYAPFILRYKDDPRFAAFCQKVGPPVPAQARARKSVCPDLMRRPPCAWRSPNVIAFRMQRGRASDWDV
jgi:hypothetical protein